MTIKPYPALRLAAMAVALLTWSVKAASPDAEFDRRIVTNLTEFMAPADPVLRAPEHVTLWVVAPKQHRESFFDCDEGASRTLSAAETDTLKRLLYSPRTYEWPFQRLENGELGLIKVSGYSPWNVKLRASKGAESVVMYFGFPGNIALQVDGGPYTIVYMATGRSALLAFFQKLFPDEPALRSEQVRQ